MNRLSLSLPADRTNFEPGEEIQVIAGWVFDRAPAEVELRAVWNTSGKGSRDLGIGRKWAFENCSAQDQRRQGIVLPTRPYSYSGKLISIQWGLELVAMPSKTAARVDIVIGPGGVAVKREPSVAGS